MAGVVSATARAESSATTSAPTTRTLTLEQALAQAKKNNRSLTAEQARLEQAQVNVDRAWTVLFPTLAAQGKFTRNNTAFPFQVNATEIRTIQPVNQLDAAINFTMPLLVPAAYPALHAVEMNQKVSEETYKTSLDNILFAVAQTFHSAVLADEVLLARRANITVTRATLTNAQTRFSAGSVTKVDVDRAELAVLRAVQAERDAQLALDQTYRALATLIQEPPGFHVVAPTATAPAATTASDAGGNVDLALHLRPEFRSLEATIEAENAEQRSYAWKWAPSLSGFGNARRFNYQNFKGDSYAWAVGLQLDWILYDGGIRDTQRHLAGAIAKEIAVRADVLRDTIRDDIANGLQQIATKTQGQQTAERSVDLARETIELVRVQYEAGTATQVDLLQAQDNLVAAQDALARARFDIALADLTVRRASGTLAGR